MHRTTIVAAVLIVAASACGGTSSLGAHDAVPHSSPVHGLAVARGDLTAATVEVTSGATSVTVKSADLHGHLLTAATPSASSQRPTVDLGSDGTATVALASIGGSGGGPSDLALVLDSSVRWSIQLDGGATSETIDLRGTKAHTVSLGAGVTRATVELPAASGHTTFNETGGASDLTISVPKSVATDVHVTGGASSARIGATTHSGVAGGTDYRDPAYATAANRLDVELTAGVSSFVLQRT